MRAHPMILAALVAALAPVQLSCGVSGYCIDCIDAQGGPADASTIDANAAIDATDSGPPPDACVPSGIEVCDDLDNDCNGEVDDGDLAGVGATCSTDVGECVPGTTECVDGHIVCGGGGVLPSIEVCDNLDNDCNGDPDDDNPEGGAFCGTDLGECHSGITQCVDGDVNCVGNYDGTDEACNGLDDDCDNLFDEGLGTNGNCGPTQGDEGECALGLYHCLGGEWQCVGAQYPTLEQCDILDHDCDGNAFNGFNFPSDARNCGPADNVASCGNVCTDNFSPLVPDPHVTSVRCSLGVCQIAFCETGFWNENGLYSDGCEYACSFQSSVDICNQVDDDCDGDIDEDATPPPNFCDPDGECANPPGSGVRLTPTCTTEGWICDYDSHTGDVSTDGDNHIVPEADCDNQDNDCDGNTDDAFPLWGSLCYDDGDGICRRSGSYLCNLAGDGLACDVTSPVVTPGTETCNGLDDNCDGTIDNGWQTGSLHDWVAISSGGLNFQVFRHEATRPDARQTTVGGVETYPCSRADALPWTNIKQPAAEAACTAIGARLCTEAEWQLACKTPLPNPIVQDSTADHLVVIEAEIYDTNTAGTEGTWSLSTFSGYSGTGSMRWLPDNGNSNTAANAVAGQSPRLSFNVTFNQTGTHYIWVRGFAADTSDDRVHVGIDGAIPTTGDDIGNFPAGSWGWRSYDDSGVRRTLDVTAMGAKVVSVWGREDGFYVDKVILTTSSTFVPDVPRSKGPFFGCGWSFATNCSTYQPESCNGNDYDSVPGGADDDQMTYTGQMAQCYANWGSTNRVYDMSGNVKEWTAERAADTNPIRGGSFTSPSEGISCENNFTVADDSFFFPNVGFRCCR